MPSLPAYRKILVIQTAFLGDVILLTSLLEKLHHYYPNASLTVLVKKGNGGIFFRHPFVHQLWEMDKSDRSLREISRWIVKIRNQKFDLVVNAHRYFRSGLLAGFSGAKHIAGYKENPLSFLFNHTARFRIGDGTHEIERLNSLVEDFLGKEVFRPKLYPPEGDVNSVRKYQGTPYVCFAPGSVWFTKQLPEKKWVELGCKTDEKKTIYLIGSVEDFPLAENILKELKGNSRNHVYNLCGQLTILQTAALMGGAEMNYVNDSAALHIASAMNAPVTAFFCSTVPEFGFYPLSDRSRILQVMGLKCRPCCLHGRTKCPEKNFACGQKIIIE